MHTFGDYDKYCIAQLHPDKIFKDPLLEIHFFKTKFSTKVSY